VSIYNDDTPIIACSSGSATNVAISVIRLSGFSSLIDFSTFFSTDLERIKPRTAYFSKLLDGKGVVLDEVVFTFFASPHSYNGENILEISVHGNRLNVRRIINILVSTKKVRVAAPGEFTLRALKNGKLNLSQVEGLDLALNASSNFVLDQGMNLLNGELFKKFTELHFLFTKLKASLELGIDFADDIGEEQFYSELNNNFEKFLNSITQLYDRSRQQHANLLHPTVAIYGPTNSGKSTLFNLLVGEKRAIVSEKAGTTRDYLSEYILVDDCEFRLIDTAGIRNATDTIEREGITRAKNILKKAFFKILLLNPNCDNSQFLAENGQQTFDLILYTHSDAVALSEYLSKLEHGIEGADVFYCSLISSSGPIGPGKSRGGSIGPGKSTGGSIGPGKSTGGSIGPGKSTGGSIGPGNSTGGSIGPGKSTGGSIGPKFKRKNDGDWTPKIIINSLISKKYTDITKNKPILLERHVQTIQNIFEESLKFQAVMIDVRDLGILSSELNILNNSVIELIGIITPDDVLSSIFENFCIGK